MEKKKKIIAVVPCYNEEESLPHLIEAFGQVRDKLTPKYRLDLLLINDGSSDSTQKVIEKLAEENDYVYYRQFAHNAGHQSALRAGINAAIAYDAVVNMDADLQQPPELIPDMIKEWEKGVEIVQMVRRDTARETGTLKYFIRQFYYRMLNGLSDLSLEYGASDFRLIDKSVAETVAKSPETDLFLRGYFSWLPVQRATIEYKPRQRVAGVSKYTLKKLLHLAYQSILQFSEKPLRLAVSVGMFLAAISFLYGVALIILHASGRINVSGWTSLMVIVLFCFGLNFIMLGIIGRYLAHAMSIQKQRPEFIIASQKLPEKVGVI